MPGVKDDEQEALAVPDTVSFTTEQRVEFLANLIVNRILEDVAVGCPLLQSLGGTDP